MTCKMHIVGPTEYKWLLSQVEGKRRYQGEEKWEPTTISTNPMSHDEMVSAFDKLIEKTKNETGV